MDYYENNDLCEICLANRDPDPRHGIWDFNITLEFYEINTHCIELRRNRKARDYKNVIPTDSVF